MSEQVRKEMLRPLHNLRPLMPGEIYTCVRACVCKIICLHSTGLEFLLQVASNTLEEKSTFFSNLK